MLLNLLKNNVSKSLLYILFFAGILKLSGMLLTWFWNDYLVDNFNVEQITFLESVGMIAFFYLVYSGVKFGFNTLTANLSVDDKMSPGNMPQCQNCDKISTSNNVNSLKNLTADEKEKLKEAIAKCCGFNHISNNIEVNSKIHIHPSHKIIK
jgi:hypothetical protein